MTRRHPPLPAEPDASPIGEREQLRDRIDARPADGRRQRRLEGGLSERGHPSNTTSSAPSSGSKPFVRAASAARRHCGLQYLGLAARARPAQERLAAVFAGQRRVGRAVAARIVFRALLRVRTGGNSLEQSEHR